MAEDSGAERTEAATPRRIIRAREQGQAALSREAAPFAVLAVASVLLALSASSAARVFVTRLTGFLDVATPVPPGVALRSAMGTIALLAGPFLFACIAAGAIAVLAQTGGLLHLSALAPDLARLDPRRGLHKIFSSSALLEVGKSVLKLAAAGAVVWWLLRDSLPLLATSLLWDPTTLLGRTSGRVQRLIIALLIAQGAIAGLDIVRARIKHTGDLRMSRQDVRDEMKETEGDPHIKARIRRLRQQRARRRMMKAVPTAAVVVTNPTHYAVALAYTKGSGGAPRVVAKGMDSLAERIRAAAREHNVPLVANPPLARTLYVVDLDQEIPRELYQAVAELIAYVWRLRGRAI